MSDIRKKASYKSFKKFADMGASADVLLEIVEELSRRYSFGSKRNYESAKESVEFIIEESEQQPSITVSLWKRYDENGAFTHDTEIHLGIVEPPKNSMWRFDSAYTFNESQSRIK
jgi:hypothetical protein